MGELIDFSHEKWTRDFWARQQKNYELAVEKIFSGEYMKWLSSFLKEHQLIATDTAWINGNFIGEDRVNIFNLCILYEMVAYYCENHEIPPVVIRESGDKKYGGSFGEDDYAFSNKSEENAEDEYYFISINIGRGGATICGLLKDDEAKKNSVSIQDVIAYEKNIT